MAFIMTVMLSYLAVSLGVLLWSPAAAQDWVHFEHCFLQMEGLKDVVLAPMPALKNGGHMWQAVDSLSGQFLKDQWLYWDLTSWKFGAKDTGKALGEISPPPGSVYDGSQACFDDYSEVKPVGTAGPTGRLNKLEPPYYTTCAPIRGRPIPEDFSHSIEISTGKKSLRDCVADAMAAKQTEYKPVTAVMFDEKAQTCTAFVEEPFEYSAATWDMTATSKLSCIVGCLLMHGNPIVGDGQRAKTAYFHIAFSLDQCTNIVNQYDRNAQGVLLTRPDNWCYGVQKMDGAKMGGDNLFCFNPSVFDRRYMAPPAKIPTTTPTPPPPPLPAVDTKESTTPMAEEPIESTTEAPAAAADVEEPTESTTEAPAAAADVEEPTQSTTEAPAAAADADESSSVAGDAEPEGSTVTGEPTAESTTTPPAPIPGPVPPAAAATAAAAAGEEEEEPSTMTTVDDSTGTTEQAAAASNTKFAVSVIAVLSAAGGLLLLGAGFGLWLLKPEKQTKSAEIDEADDEPDELWELEIE